MLNQRTAAIAIHRIGIRFTCALLLIGASSLASAQEGGPTLEDATTLENCTSAFRDSPAGDSGCELGSMTTVDGETCYLIGACPGVGDDWVRFNIDVDIRDVNDLQNCDGQLRAECNSG